jgi:hypothetical protein
MFTETFTIDRHIEELRAELRGTADMEEAHWINLELGTALLMREDLIREAEAKG